MISDSAYGGGELVLRPWQGAVAGALGAGIMMAAGLSIMTPVPHFCWGIVLGWLYALCQQNVPVRGLVAVGIFYGVFLWVIGCILGRLLRHADIMLVQPNRIGLASTVLFSATLAVVAIAVHLTRPESTQVLPKD